MDTTAAAELGTGVVDGPGFWDSGVGEGEAWGEKGNDEHEEWGEGGGEGAGGHGSGRGGQRSSTGGSESEPPLKRMKNMGGEVGGGFGPGGGYGPGQNAGFGGGGGSGEMEPGSRGGFSQGLGASPGMKSPFSSGNINGGFGPGLGPPPGTPNGDSGAGQGMGRGRGSIFYKTKLCSRFRNGNCPYSTNCNFAHGMEELRKPPPGWEDTVSIQEGGTSAPSPVVGPQMNAGPNSSDMQRFHKTRPCKKYFSEMGCPYGDRCNFLHDESSSQPKPAREPLVVNPPSNGTGSGNGNGNGVPSGGSGGAVGGGAPATGGINQRPPNWKTRLCNKWETTGNCPFGEKCHFAHGAAELQRYGGGPIDPSVLDGVMLNEMKFGGNFSGSHFSDMDDPFQPSGEGHLQGANGRQQNTPPAQHIMRTSSGLGSGEKMAGSNWKGPVDGISTIYGDWIEDEEWEYPNHQAPYNSQQFVQSPPGDLRGTEEFAADSHALKAKAQPLQQMNFSNKVGHVNLDPSGQRPVLGSGGFSGTTRNGVPPFQGMQGVDSGFGMQGPVTARSGSSQVWGVEL